MKTLYPAIEPYATYHLPMDDLHRVYVEECGNRAGLPVIFLHGGPASGCKPHHRSFFDPQRYRIILFDQRGAGRSMPSGELKNNTTQNLIDDMERIRQHFGIERWLLFGGSWGAALALLYAQRYPERVTGLIIRGAFLARRADLEWFTERGVNRVYPEQWQRLISCIPEVDRGDLIAAITKKVHGRDELAQRRVAREWECWSAQAALGSEFSPADAEEHVSAALLDQVRIEMHYASHHYFIAENQILEQCSRTPDVPTEIIHGRNDLVCPVESGWSLAERLPHAAFRVLPRSGHVAYGEEMIHALVTATDAMADRLSP
jgi:proline iminopeptidase